MNDKDAQIWYSTAIKHTNTLRYHLDEILNEVDVHNRICKTIGVQGISEKKLSQAREAQQKCEDFFTWSVK